MNLSTLTSDNQISINSGLGLRLTSLAVVCSTWKIIW